MFFLIFFNCIDRNLRGYIVRKVKLARADTAERYTLQTVLLRFIQTGDITAFEQLAVLVCEPAADNRSYCVDNILARKIISTRQFSFSGFTAMERFTFFQQLRSSCAVNRPIDSATAKQGLIRRVYDGVNIGNLRDIAFYRP